MQPTEPKVSMTPRVLIVEDDPAQRRILEEMVKRFGLDPVSADSGPKGLEILGNQSGGQIELVILDLVMPGMDGLEFLERMTAIRGDLPVIVRDRARLDRDRHQGDACRRR